MKLLRSIAALTCLLLIYTVAHAQGIIIPGPCQRCARPLPPNTPLPLTLKVKSIHITTKITEQVATTKVEQVFENDTPYLLEGTYFFPLPESGAISEFAMWDGDKRLVGEVRSRTEARRIYDEIVRSRRDPALLEYAGKNLFQASVFPIPPRSDKKIELTYTQALRNEHGTAAYRYPLGTGWRANGVLTDWPPPQIPMPMPRPRVPNERPQPLPDAPGRISAEVEISSRVAIKGIYSPSHDIEVKLDGERRARVSFEVRGAAAQPDFQLFYAVSDKEFGLSLLTHREPGKDGYFMLRVSPKTELDEREVSAKDVIFVLDTSGSMADDGKMEKAKAALRHGVGALSARDRFNIISFAGEEHLMSAQTIAADDDGKRKAREFIERMRATGGTNINDALLAALKQFQENERPRLIVFITDGQPTVGTTNISRIQQNVKQANRANVRLFTFGVGYDVNTLLLDGLAADNHGAADYIEPNEDIEVKVSNFFAKVNYPVLSDIKIDWGGVEVEKMYPREIPDLFHGSQLALIGRYRLAHSSASSIQSSPLWMEVGARLIGFFATGYWCPLSTSNATTTVRRITITGKVNGQERRFVYDDAEFPETLAENEFLPQLWATRRVGYLMEQIRLSGESRELREEIIELGTRYGIVTPYTSYLVLEPGMQVQSQVRGGHTNQVVVQGASEVPRPAATPAPSLLPGLAAGEAAVKDSKQKAEFRDADKIAASKMSASSTNQLRTVAGKTFYLRDGVWTDSEFKADAKLSETKITFASEAYFALLAQEPKLADFFALGKQVVVVWKGKIYRVSE